MPRSNTFIPDPADRAHNASTRSINSNTWSVGHASIPSDQSHYSIHDVDGSDSLDISDNIQSNKNSDEEADDKSSCSQSINSQYSDEDDNNNMPRNLSQRSMNSTGGGHYVQVNLIPSNAPARRPRSRSRSTNGSADVNNSERSGIEIYTEGNSHGRLSDSTSSFQENSPADVVAAAIAAVSAACDSEQSQHQHHHHPRYEHIDSRSNSEMEDDNVQLSGRRESQYKFSGNMKRQSRMNYTAKKRHSLRDSAIKIMSLQRLSSKNLDPDNDDSGDVQDGVDLEPSEEVLELWREVADDLDGGEFDFSCCLYTM